MSGTDADRTVHENYLRDVGTLIAELAREAKREAGATQADFATGYMAGFHRVVSLMLQQGEAFGIPAQALGLAGIDPDADLV